MRMGIFIGGVMNYKRIGEEVYISPSDGRGDCIVKIIGESGGTYSTTKGSWFDDFNLMPTEGMSLEECREKCVDYFGDTPDELRRLHLEAWAKTPLGKHMMEGMDSFTELFRKSYRLHTK